MNDTSRMEKAARRFARFIKECRIPLITAVIVGYLAHGFAFSNKLLNADEVLALFSKGGGTSYGRWAIDSTAILFPNVSMPWIYGFLSIAMAAFAVCLTVRIFRIRSKVLQALLAGVMISFPAMTALYCYMFTAAPFALALLLAVLSVRFGQKDSLPGWGAAAALLVLSLGIYQAYIAVAASWYLILMMQRLLRGEKAGPVFRFGLRALGALAVSVLVYYLISRLSIYRLGLEYAEHGFSRYSLPYRFALAYNAFLKTFTRGYFALIAPGASKYIHWLSAGLVLLVFANWFASNRDPAAGGLLLLCLLLLPLAMNCMFLEANPEVIQAIVLYSFTAVYVLAAVSLEAVAEKERGPRRWRAAGNVLAAALALVVAANVYFANQVYMKLHLQYENAYALYTGVAAQVRMTEGFDENTPVALIGKTSAGLYHPEELDSGDLIGPPEDLVNVYSRKTFIERYVGFDVPFATQEECRKLEQEPEVQQMPSYPYYGSVKKVGDYVVVKLG